jgi:hypothetical protein
MAETDLAKAQREVAKEAAINSEKSLAAIKDLLAEDRKDNKLQAKDRVKLLKQSALIEKSNRTLSSDLGKNFSDLKDGFASSVDGLISSTFGPFSGIVSSFTTGFAKRAEEAAEQIDAQNAAAQDGREMAEKLGGMKVSGEDTVFQLKEVVTELKEINGKTVVDPDDPFGKKKLERLSGTTIPSGSSDTGSRDEDEGGFLGKLGDSILTGLGIGGGIGGVKGIKALAIKYTKFAKGVSFGVVGKIFSTANPIFAAVAMGKDVFDIADAMTDNDIRTEFKGRDIGGLLLGVIGGGIGFALGNPLLGIALGNMAGEFLGEKFETPNMAGIVEDMKKRFSEREASLVAEQAENAKIMISGTDAEKEVATRQNKNIKKQLTIIRKQLADLNNKDGAIAKANSELQAIAELSDINMRKRFALERQIEEAIEAGNHKKVARLQVRLDLVNEEQDKIQDRFDLAGPILQKALQDHSNAFYKFATSPIQQLLDPIGDAANKKASEITKKLEKIFGEGVLATTVGGTAGGFLKFLDYTALLVQILDPTSNNFMMTGLGLANLNKYIGKIFPEKGVFGSIASLLLSADTDQFTEDGIPSLLKRPDKNMVGPNQVLEQKPAPSIVKKHTGGPINRSGLYDLEAKEMVFTEEQTKVLASYLPQSGQIMNRLQMERMSGGAGGMHGASVVTGNDMSSNQVSNNSTVNNFPSPIGQTLPDEGRDFVSKIG